MNNPSEIAKPKKSPKFLFFGVIVLCTAAIFGFRYTRVKDKLKPKPVEPPSLAVLARLGELDRLTREIDKGGKVDDLSFGITPLTAALQGGQWKVAQYLISKGASIKQTLPVYDRAGILGCITTACRDQVALNPEAISLAKLILDNNPNCTRKNNYGRNALHEACIANCQWMVQLLIERHFDPNEPDDKGETAIFGAVQSKNPEIVTMIIRSGADLQVKNKSYITAQDLAERKHAPATILALLK